MTEEVQFIKILIELLKNKNQLTSKEVADSILEIKGKNKKTSYIAAYFNKLINSSLGIYIKKEKKGNKLIYKLDDEVKNKSVKDLFDLYLQNTNLINKDNCNCDDSNVLRLREKYSINNYLILKSHPNHKNPKNFTQADLLWEATRRNEDYKKEFKEKSKDFNFYTIGEMQTLESLDCPRAKQIMELFKKGIWPANSDRWKISYFDPDITIYEIKKSINATGKRIIYSNPYSHIDDFFRLPVLFVDSSLFTKNIDSYHYVHNRILVSIDPKANEEDIGKNLKIILKEYKKNNLLFKSSDLIKPSELLVKLLNADDSFSSDLIRWFSFEFQNKLYRYSNGDTDNSIILNELLTELLTELNTILMKPIFKNFEKEDEIIEYNRKALEDHYKGEFVPCYKTDKKSCNIRGIHIAIKKLEKYDKLITYLSNSVKYKDNLTIENGAIIVSNNVSFSEIVKNMLNKVNHDENKKYNSIVKEYQRAYKDAVELIQSTPNIKF